MSLEKQIYTPTLLWFQNKEYIYLNFELHNVSNNSIKILENKILFSAVSNENNYEMNFELFENINIDKSFFVVDEKSISMTLKKNNDENWTYLTKEKNTYKNNIKINWNRWINEDDDEEEENNVQNNQQFDFQKMMESMGGMGGMGGMKGMEGMGGMKGMGGMEDMEGMEDIEEMKDHDNCECCLEDEEDEDIKN